MRRIGRIGLKTNRMEFRSNERDGKNKLEFIDIGYSGQVERKKLNEKIRVQLGAVESRRRGKGGQRRSGND